MARGKSQKVIKNPIAYVIHDKHFGDLEVLNTANAWWLDQAKVHDLISSFKIDATVEEALVYAGITRDQWEYFKKKHPKFYDIKEAIKELPVLKARQAVVSGLTNFDNGLRYLERKRKDEFSTKTINENTDTIKIEYKEEAKKRTGKFIDRVSDMARRTRKDS